MMYRVNYFIFYDRFMNKASKCGLALKTPAVGEDSFTRNDYNDLALKSV